MYVAWHSRQPGIYRAGEVGGAIDVAGTIDPAMAIGPVAYRKLEEPVALPVEIGLAAHSGAGDDVERLAAGEQLVSPAGHRGLHDGVAL